MKIFNGEFIIGTDGVISARPRGNYPDRWAVRPEDLQDGKLRKSIAEIIQGWFNKQTESDLSHNIDEYITAIREHLHYGVAHLTEIELINHQIVPRMGSLWQQQSPGTSPHEIWIRLSNLPLRSKDVVLDKLVTLGVSRQESEPAWEQWKAAYEQTAPCHTRRDAFIRNELQHAFSKDSLSAHDAATLEKAITLLSHDLKDEAGYNYLKTLVRSNMEQLRNDPVKKIDAAVHAYFQNLDIEETVAQERTRQFDMTLNELLKKDSAQTAPEFRKALQDTDTVSIISPTSQIQGPVYACPFRRLNTNYNGDTAPKDGACSPYMPMIEIGYNGGLKETRHILLEESSHLIEQQGRFKDTERATFDNVHRKMMHSIARHTAMPDNSSFSFQTQTGATPVVLGRPCTGDELVSMLDPHRGQQHTPPEIMEIFRSVARHCKNSLNWPEERMKHAIAFLVDILNNMRYQDIRDSIIENKADALTLRFDTTIPEADKAAIFQQMGIDEDVNHIVSSLSRPSTMQFTYAPDSLEQKTMERLRGIEFLGPSHYAYINTGLAAART